MTRNPRKPVKVGIFGIGLAAYWPQFEGLKERLEGYQRFIEQKLAGPGVEICSAGLVDTAPGAQAAGDYFAQQNVDLILCYVGTYATSSQVLPAVQRRQCPVLVLNLQPVPTLDYPNTDTGKWLAGCSACSVPEISNAFVRADIPFHVVTGLLQPVGSEVDRFHEEAFGEIQDYILAAGIQQQLSYGRIGFLGHTYPGMVDMYSDFAMFHGQLGLHIEVLEMDDLHERVAQTSASQVAAKVQEIRETFDFMEPGTDQISMEITEEGLDWSAKVACGLDALVADFDLQGLTYYYRGLSGNANEELGSSLIVGNSLLTGRGIPASGEGDLKTCVAMFIMDRLRAGGSYTEFYAMDFTDDILLMGHDGPGHIAISDGKPTLRGLGLFHGKRGYGLSVEFQVSLGPVTILCLTQTRDGNFKMLAAEGMSEAGPTLAIGNTNSRIRFPQGVTRFMNEWLQEGPTHHVALGRGHQVARLQKLARILEMELVVIQ